jgi:hypothetical protein
VGHGFQHKHIADDVKAGLAMWRVNDDTKSCLEFEYTDYSVAFILGDLSTTP